MKNGEFYLKKIFLNPKHSGRTESGIGAFISAKAEYHAVEIPANKRFPLSALIDSLPWKGSGRSYNSITDATIPGYTHSMGELGFRLEREEFKDTGKGYIRIVPREAKAADIPPMNIEYDLNDHYILAVNTGKPLSQVTSTLQPLLRGGNGIFNLAYDYLIGHHEGTEVSKLNVFGGPREYGPIPNWNNRDIEHQAWEDPAHIRRFEYVRQVFRPANEKIVKEILDTYVPTEKPIVEVGAGTGELLKVVPEYAKRVVATEQSERSLIQNPTAKKVRADAYDLPFSNNSTSAVVGYASYDTFLDLPLAMEEAERVLQNGGVFIHFLDIDACASTVFFNEQRRGMVILPSRIKKENGFPVVKVIRLEDILSKYKDIPSHLQKFIGNYIGNQEEQYRELMSSPEYNQVKEELATFADTLTGEEITFKSYFKQKLEEATRDFAGLNIEISEYRSATAIVSKEDITADMPNKFDGGPKNAFNVNKGNEAFNYTGQLKIQSNEQVKSGEILAHSTMYVFVARKSK